MKSSINNGGWNCFGWILFVIGSVLIRAYVTFFPEATKISAVPLESVAYTSPTDQVLSVGRERVKVFYAQTPFLQSEVDNWFVEMEKAGASIQVIDRLQSSYENRWVTITVWYRHVHNK